MSKLNPTVSRRWLILFTVYLCQLAMALAFQSVPPVIPLIIEDLQISHAQAGLLMGLFFFPGIFLSIPAGVLSDKYGARKIIVPSLLLIIAGCLMVALSPTYFLIGVGRFITGLGALSFTVVIPTIIARWFMGKELGLSMSLLHTGVPMGAIISFNAMPRLAEMFNWRSSQWLTASFTLIALLVFLLVYRDNEQESKGDKNITQKSSVNIFRIGSAVWLLGIIWMLYTSSISSFMNFSTDFLIKNGFSITSAGFASGLFPLTAVLCTPIVGLLLDRFNSQKLFIGSAGIILAGFYFILYYFTFAAIPVMLIVGGFTALIPPSVSTSVQLYEKRERLGLAFGLTNTLSNAGGLVAPFIAGYLTDLSGSYIQSFWFYSFLSILITVLVILSISKKKEATSLIK